MHSVIIGTAGHIDHGKTALIKALNGFEGDESIEEQKRGITIDLSFSNLKIGQKNIAFVDVPGHEKLVKNMIAGAFGFNAVMLVIAADDGIMPQTREHVEIISLLGIKDLIVVITKKDLVESSELEELHDEVDEYLSNFNFSIEKLAVSIYENSSIDALKDLLFSIDLKIKEEENFFRYYIDRVFSPKGIGTVVTGTILGKPLDLNERVFICELKKEVKVKNIQVHGSNALEAKISNRAALNLSNIDAKQIKKGFLISKKGFLRGFNSVEISFDTLPEKELFHNREYTIYIGSKKLNGKILLFGGEEKLQKGFAKLKLEEEIFSIFGEKLILRENNQTISGGKVLNPINDPLKNSQKLQLLNSLDTQDLEKSFQVLLQAHKKGLGLISSFQRFGKSHEEVLSIAKGLDNVYVDEKSLVIYPKDVLSIIKKMVKEIFIKNSYALLSSASLVLRIKWASESLIETVLKELVKEAILKFDEGLYRSSEIKTDLEEVLRKRILERLKEEGVTPTAPYNIYDDLDLDRKTGDKILKALCKSKNVIRLQHNLFIEATNLKEIIETLRAIIKEKGYVDIKNFKESVNISRKYLVAYLDFLDNYDDIEKRENRRVFK